MKQTCDQILCLDLWGHIFNSHAVLLKGLGYHGALLFLDQGQLILNYQEYQILLPRHGVIVNKSNAENPEPPLRINGTEANNGTTVVCLGIDLNDITNRCQSQQVTVVLYGTSCNNVILHINNYYSLDRPPAPENLTVFSEWAWLF